ncbi:40S ribosomal protein S15a-1 [Tanacetum coccineum]|uniref:40S ribosomal protein S15a-1 n=1 Tax=Tanacetum coccineum TaxID=301880 RepID=A0ABQ5EG87_9ASTR
MALVTHQLQLQSTVKDLERVEEITAFIKGTICDAQCLQLGVVSFSFTFTKEVCSMQSYYQVKGLSKDELGPSNDLCGDRIKDAHERGPTWKCKRNEDYKIRKSIYAQVYTRGFFTSLNYAQRAPLEHEFIRRVATGNVLDEHVGSSNAVAQVSVLNDALKSMYNAEKRGKRQVMIKPSSKVVI